MNSYALGLPRPNPLALYTFGAQEVTKNGMYRLPYAIYYCTELSAIAGNSPAHQLAVFRMRSSQRVCTLVFFNSRYLALQMPLEKEWNVILDVAISTHHHTMVYQLCDPDECDIREGCGYDSQDLGAIVARTNTVIGPGFAQENLGKTFYLRSQWSVAAMLLATAHAHRDL